MGHAVIQAKVWFKKQRHRVRLVLSQMSALCNLFPGEGRQGGSKARPLPSHETPFGALHYFPFKLVPLRNANKSPFLKSVTQMLAPTLGWLFCFATKHI